MKIIYLVPNNEKYDRKSIFLWKTFSMENDFSKKSFSFQPNATQS